MFIHHVIISAFPWSEQAVPGKEKRALIGNPEGIREMALLFSKNGTVYG